MGTPNTVPILLNSNVRTLIFRSICTTFSRTRLLLAFDEKVNIRSQDELIPKGFVKIMSNVGVSKHEANDRTCVHGWMAFAKPNAAADAMAPMSAVWKALRKGLLSVKRPLAYPKISNASKVTTIDATRASLALGKKT